MRVTSTTPKAVFVLSFGPLVLRFQAKTKSKTKDGMNETVKEVPAKVAVEVAPKVEVAQDVAAEAGKVTALDVVAQTLDTPVRAQEVAWGRQAGRV